MRHCLVCRRRRATQEVAFEKTLLFLCTMCLTRMEMEHAAYDCSEQQMDDDEPYGGRSIAFLHKEKIR